MLADHIREKRRRKADRDKFLIEQGLSRPHVLLAVKVDRVCRWLLPVSFSIFVIVMFSIRDSGYGAS